MQKKSLAWVYLEYAGIQNTQINFSTTLNIHDIEQSTALRLWPNKGKLLTAKA